MTSSSETLASEIKTLGEEIKALDKAVAEGTEQRKEEHADFLTFQTESNAAVQLIEKAKNRPRSGTYDPRCGWVGIGRAGEEVRYLCMGKRLSARGRLYRR